MAASYIIDAVRTPRGRGKAGKGALSGIHPQELLAQVLQALEQRGSLASREVDDVIAGCVSQAGEQGANIARNAVLAAGWPYEVSAASINRFCASGLQAIHFGAMGVGSGAQELVVAGGVESMSRVPMGSDGGGVDGNNLHLRERAFQVPQGVSADLIATMEGFSRAELDEVALRSQRNAAHAIEEKRFARSVIPVKDPFTGKVMLDHEEFVRPDTTAEGLAALKPSFVALGAAEAGPKGETLDQLALAVYPKVKGIEHLHTAGNSSGIVDGAAVVALASERYVQQKGIKPRARIRAMATLGSEPVLMLTAPAPTSEKALRLAGMKASDIDLWEINEAFAGVVLQTIRKLGIDPAKVNVNGGAIALGHPLGATGAMLLGTALDELERTGKQTALITMCVGGGQGIATILERISAMNAKTEQKERTHQAILASAGRLLREKGISGASVGDVMKGAGLTVGGFYAHFGSKDDLIEETLRRAGTRIREILFARLEEKPEADRAEVVLKRYLSAAHRDEVAEGCSLPAVVGEVSTTSPQHRPALARQLEALASGLEELLPTSRGVPRRQLALGLVALMYGGLTLSRALKGTELSDEMLRACRALGALAARNSAERPIGVRIMSEALRSPKTTGHVQMLQKMITGEVSGPPVAQLIGFTITAIEIGRSTFTMDASSKHANPMGTLHGGVVCDIADAAMGTAMASTLEDDESFTTLDLTAKYFKPIWNARIRATAQVVKRTRTLGLIECDVVDDSGSLVARVYSTCMVLRGTEAKGR